MTKLEFSRRSDIDVIMPVNSLTDSEMSTVCDCSASLSITDTVGCWQNSAKTISLAVNWQLWTWCTISTLTCTLTLVSPKYWTSFSTSIMTPRCYLISSETFLSLSLPNSLGINFCALCSLINTSCTFCRVRKIYRNSSSAKNSSAYWTSRATSTITRFNLWAYGNRCIYGTFMQLSDVCLKPDYTTAHYSRTVVALCYDNTTTKSQSCQRWQNGSRKRLCININHICLSWSWASSSWTVQTGQMCVTNAYVFLLLSRNIFRIVNRYCNDRSISCPHESYWLRCLLTRFEFQNSGVFGIWRHFSTLFLEICINGWQRRQLQLKKIPMIPWSFCLMMSAC